jgi:hypothetical protein
MEREDMTEKKVRTNRPVMMDERSHEHLAWVSKVTGISQKRILENFISELFSLSIEYDHATLRIDSRITDDKVEAILHGYGKKLSFGIVKTEQELRNVTFDKINEDLKKKAMGLDI